MENNPNMIDCLFVPRDCIILETPESDIILDNKWSFLHKGCFHKFAGYAHSQLRKIRNKEPEGKRKIIVDTFGYDTKYGSHLYRLANECEQILTTGDIDLRQSSGQMRAIRKGDVSLSELETWFAEKEVELKELYDTTEVVPHSPNEPLIKGLLIKCLEIYYGDLKKFGVDYGTGKLLQSS